MTTKELRAEWCKKKGFNYIDFDTLREAEEYILFLESKLEALNIADVVGQSEQYFCCKDKINQRCSEQCLGCFQFQNKD